MSVFISHKGITAFWPIDPPPTQSTLVRWSKLRKFPSFWRAGNNRKSPPMWNQDEVEKWVETHFAPFFNTKRNGKTK